MVNKFNDLYPIRAYDVSLYGLFIINIHVHVFL